MFTFSFRTYQFRPLEGIVSTFFRGCRLMKPSLIYAYNLLNNAVRRLPVLTFAVESPTFTHRLWDVPCLMEDLLFTLCTEPRSWGYMYAREAFRELGQESHFFLQLNMCNFHSFWVFLSQKTPFPLGDQWPVRFSEPTAQWDGTPMGGPCSFIGTETLGGMANSEHREYRGQIPRPNWEDVWKLFACHWWIIVALRGSFFYRNQRCERPIFTRSHLRSFCIHLLFKDFMEILHHICLFRVLYSNHLLHMLPWK